MFDLLLAKLSLLKSVAWVEIGSSRSGNSIEVALIGIDQDGKLCEVTQYSGAKSNDITHAEYQANFHPLSLARLLDGRLVDDPSCRVWKIRMKREHRTEAINMLAGMVKNLERI